MLQLEKMNIIQIEKRRKVRRLALTQKGIEIYSYLNKIYGILGEEL